MPAPVVIWRSGEPDSRARESKDVVTLLTRAATHLVDGTMP